MNDRVTFWFVFGPAERPGAWHRVLRLKREFGHVSVFTRPLRDVVGIEGTRWGLAIEATGQEPDGLARLWKSTGRRVLKITVDRPAGERYILRVWSCNNVAKAVLGMGGLRPLTPEGLYRELLAMGAVEL